MKTKYEESVIKQVEDVVEILKSALDYKKLFYEVKITDENGERTVLESHEKHLETLIEISIEDLECLLDDVKERRTLKEKMHVLKTGQ